MAISSQQIEESVPVAETSSEHHPLRIHRIDPGRGWHAINFAELWSYRTLIWRLAMRDIGVRYKQTLLGAAWAIIQPLLTTLIMFVTFYRVAGLKVDGPAPQFVLMFAGMIIWQLFETSLTNAGNSLVASQNLITKVYFPRLTIPLSSLGSGL